MTEIEHPTDVRQLLVHPALWPTLIGWLEGHGLEVNRMHAATPEELATYTISPCVLQADGDHTEEETTAARLASLEEGQREQAYDLRHTNGYVRGLRRRLAEVEKHLGIKPTAP